MLRKWLVYAPSNIALIKYMGKHDFAANLPANPSISLTLDGLRTWVEIENRETDRALGAENTKIRFIPELPRDLPPNQKFAPEVPELTQAGVERVIRHLRRVQQEVPALFSKYGLRPDLRSGSQLEFRTANTFPISSGIASSASSFAALTLATAMASCEDRDSFEKAWKDSAQLRQDLAQISRQGSGSSCRSFEGPWVIWEGENAIPLKTPSFDLLPEMTDLVLVISRAAKEVSSSQAHSLVQTSPLWSGRQERVAQRIAQMKQAVHQGNLQAMSRISWTEMWEMHSLFHTCEKPFSYWEPNTIKVLRWLAQRKEAQKDQRGELGFPIVTIDAGANIHLLIPSQLAARWRLLLKETFPEIVLLEDRQGSGAGWVNEVRL